MLIRKTFLAGLFILAVIFPAMQPGQAAAGASAEAGSVAAMQQAAEGFNKLADLAAKIKPKPPCCAALGQVAHQVRLVRADVERSGEEFSDLAARSASQGQQSGLYGDAMDSLARLAMTVDDLFLLTAELILACADPKAKAEAAELQGELAREAQAAAGEAMQSSKLQKAYLIAYGRKRATTK